MRPNRVVLLPPPFCQYLHLLQRVKDLTVQQFIPQLPVEALVIAVLPWTPWLDEQGPYTDTRQSVPDRLRRELRTVVRPDVLRHAVRREEPGEGVHHII